MKENYFKNDDTMQEMKQQRGQMKQKLLKWGGTLEFCKRKQREIMKLQTMTKQFLLLGEGTPFLGKENVSLKEAEQLYELEIKKITDCMKKEMKEYSVMERYIEQLDYDEQIFIEMRYEKGYNYEYIAMQTHKSRAKCFRDHDLILDKLIVLCQQHKMAA